MNKKIYSLLIGTALSLQNCAGQTPKEQMDSIINTVVNSVETYKNKPVYGIQANKSGCKLVIEIEGGIDYRLTENKGESMMIPLNAFILSSGKQTAIVRVYPRDGEKLLTKHAYVSLTFTEASDKDSSLKAYKKIASFSLPENIGELKVPYYEARVPFTAQVPFDYTAELLKAKDLKSIPNIEEKVVAKYQQLRSICEQKDVVGYFKERIHSSILVFNTMYNTTKEEIAKGYELYPAVVDSSLYNRELLPITHYKIQYYAGGKIVALWQSNNNPMLYIKGNYKYSDGDEAYYEGGSMLFLYMPEDSNELVIWQ